MARSTKKSQAKSPDAEPQDTVSAGDGASEDVRADMAKEETTASADADDPVEDATIVSETTADGTDAAEEAARRERAAADEIYVDPEGEAVAGSEVGPDAPDTGSRRDAADTGETDADGANTLMVPPPPPPGDAPRRGGFVPLVLGGFLAGAVGYAIAAFATDEIAAVDPARIAALEEKVAAIEPAEAAAPVDLSEIEAAQDELASDLAALGERVAALEAAPRPEPAPSGGPAEGASTATPPETASAADPLRGELQTLTGAVDEIRDRIAGLSDSVAANESNIAALRDELAARIDGVETAIAEAAARADDVEDEAAARAREAARNQVALALESGAPYAEPLDVLGDPPAPLAEPAETGVPTVAALADDFPPLAREALRAARAEAGASEGMGSLFRNAFNPRSLEPREGDDPDAVLSRAEAALRDGDVDAALAEIGALPEAASEILADWRARAETRVEAVSAAETYLQDE